LCKQNEEERLNLAFAALPHFIRFVKEESIFYILESKYAAGYRGFAKIRKNIKN